MPITDKLVSKLKRLIQDRPDLSQRIVANRANISESYLSIVLAGKRRVQIDLLEKLAAACGMSLRALIPPPHSDFKMEGLIQASGALKPKLQIKTNELNDSEKRLIRLYRMLNNKKKQCVIDYVTEVLLDQFS